MGVLCNSKEHGNAYDRYVQLRSILFNLIADEIRQSLDRGANPQSKAYFIRELDIRVKVDRLKDTLKMTMREEFPKFHFREGFHSHLHMEATSKRKAENPASYILTVRIWIDFHLERGVKVDPDYEAYPIDVYKLECAEAENALSGQIGFQPRSLMPVSVSGLTRLAIKPAAGTPWKTILRARTTLIDLLCTRKLTRKVMNHLIHSGRIIDVVLPWW